MSNAFRRSTLVLALLAGLTATASAQPTEAALLVDGLHGTLMTAARAQPHLVVIVAGSGPTNRDGNTPGGAAAQGQQADMYKQLADALAAQGYSSFRYDKRGVGASRALVADRAAAERLTIGDFADDLVKVVNGLATRPDAKSIVIAGHSEGAMLAMLATPRIRVAGLALISGAGLPFIDVLERQLQRQPLPAELGQAVTRLIAAYRTNTAITEWPPELSALFNPINDRFLRSVATLDPRDLLKPVTVPVLIVGGGKDIQVVRADFDRLESVRPTRSQILWVEDMAHPMKAARADDRSPLEAYARERPLSATFVTGLLAWLSALPATAP